jgi:choline monooxygenase
MKSYERIKYDNFFLQQVNSNILSSSVVSSRLQSSSSSSSISSNDDDESNNKALYIFHYPNLCINRYGKWMDTNIVWPVNVNECIVEFDWYVDKDMINDTNYINNCLIESEKVQLEDIWLCERVQKGLESSAYKYGGRYAPIMETGEFMFHNLLKNDLSTAIQMMMKKK